MIKGVFTFEDRHERSGFAIVDNKSIEQGQISEINIDFVYQSINIYSTEEQDIRQVDL